MKPAIFLDRDGTINKLKQSSYICNEKDVELTNGTKEALEKLKKMGYLLIVITNQTGVGAGFYTREQAELVNKKIQDLIGFNFDGIYACYHNPNEKCSCRKPSIGLIEQALKDFDINLKNSWFVGDKEKDILTGKNIGVKTCYVGKETISIKPDLICDNLLEFVNKIENSLENKILKL